MVKPQLARRRRRNREHPPATRSRGTSARRQKLTTPPELSAGRASHRRHRLQARAASAMNWPDGGRRDNYAPFHQRAPGIAHVPRGARWRLQAAVKSAHGAAPATHRLPPPLRRTPDGSSCSSADMVKPQLARRRCRNREHPPATRWRRHLRPPAKPTTPRERPAGRASHRRHRLQARAASATNWPDGGRRDNYAPFHQSAPGSAHSAGVGARWCLQAALNSASRCRSRNPPPASTAAMVDALPMVLAVHQPI
jgi:hypothetical protein